MSSICFYFQVHQPYRLKKFKHFDIGNSADYFWEEGDFSANKDVLQKVAKKSYLPTTKILLDLINQNPNFKVSFSFSGILLEQLSLYSPETLSLFIDLVSTGQAEILSETYYHSLSFLFNDDEYIKQIQKHKKLIRQIFGVTPSVFRNTELIYNDSLALTIEKLGFSGILTEGADHILGWRSPNFLYKAAPTKNLKMLLKNYKLSDDIAFRFGSKSWNEYPLTTHKFANWINNTNGNGHVVNLFMDYETFGEHQWEDTGIFNFLKNLPDEILKHPDNNFVTPSEAIEKYETLGELSIPNYISWADIERDLSAWRSNAMQEDALNKLYKMYDKVIATKDKKLIEDWRKLTTSDHFYYMCTKWFNDGDVHKYFNPYESPYDAFRYFMNVLMDLKLKIKNKNA